MPPSLRHARRLLPNVAPVSHPTHVWISDQLLQDAFASFSFACTRQHERCASNVPGPLEARRRLARRRFANGLAVTATPVTPSLSFAGLFDLTWLKQAFEPPRRTSMIWEAPTAAPLLKSQLNTDVDPPALHDDDHYFHPDDDVAEQLACLDISQEEPHTLSRVSAPVDPSSIPHNSLAESYAVLKPSYGSLAASFTTELLEQLATHKRLSRDFFEILLEPSMNEDPEECNFEAVKFVMLHFEEHGLIGMDNTEFLELSLRLVRPDHDPDQAEIILGHALKIFFRDTKEPPSVTKKKAINAVREAIAALASSPASPPASKVSILNRFVDSISIYDANAIERVPIRWMPVGGSPILPFEINRRFDVKPEWIDLATSMNSALASGTLPSDVASHLSSLTLGELPGFRCVLVQHALSDVVLKKDDSKTPKAWTPVSVPPALFDVLEVFRHEYEASDNEDNQYWDDIYRAIFPYLEPSHLHAHFERMGPRHLALYLHIWLDAGRAKSHGMQGIYSEVLGSLDRPLSNHAERYMTKYDIDTEYRGFAAISREIGHSRMGSMRALRLMLEYLLVISQPRIFRWLAIYSSRQLGLRIPPEALESYISTMPETSGDVLYMFSLNTRLQPANFPEQMEILVCDPKIDSSKLWLLILERINLRPMVSEAGSPCKVSKKQLDLMGRLALTYATADRFPHRVAFQYVSKINRMIEQWRGPDDPRIVRALVIAGLIRPLKDREIVPLGKFRYILANILRVDGAKAAEKFENLAVKQMRNIKFQYQRVTRTPLPRRRRLSLEVKTKHSTWRKEINMGTTQYKQRIGMRRDRKRIWATPRRHTPYLPKHEA